MSTSVYLVTLSQKASECKLVFVGFLGESAAISHGFCCPDSSCLYWHEVATLQAGTVFPESFKHQTDLTLKTWADAFLAVRGIQA